MRLDGQSAEMNNPGRHRPDNNMWRNIMRAGLTYPVDSGGPRPPNIRLLKASQWPPIRSHGIEKKESPAGGDCRSLTCGSLSSRAGTPLPTPLSGRPVHAIHPVITCTSTRLLRGGHSQQSACSLPEDAGWALAGVSNARPMLSRRLAPVHRLIHLISLYGHGLTLT